MTTHRMTRTSMALDGWTVQTLNELSEKWHTSKAEVIRKAIRQLKLQDEREKLTPSPSEALNWLQQGGGVLREEAEKYRAEMQANREARKYWWEA